MQKHARKRDLNLELEFPGEHISEGLDSFICILAHQMASGLLSRSAAARLAPTTFSNPRVSVDRKFCPVRRPSFGNLAAVFCLAFLVLVVGCIVHLYLFRYSGSGKLIAGYIRDTEACDVFDGSWVPDSSYPLYNSSECPFAERGFNCLENGRRDIDYLKWRWRKAM